jgi:hypothetical protein
MKTLEKKLRDLKKMLQVSGIDPKEIRRIVSTTRREYPITIIARASFDSGVPFHEGPVWFGKEKWKTDFWVRQWKLWQAYRLGQKAKDEFLDKESNPYKSQEKKYTMLRLELEAAWNLGFKGEDF